MAVDRAERRVAPRVVERHTRSCALSLRRGRRCTCTPSYVARVRRGERAYVETFATIAEAVSWAEATRDALRRHGTRPSRPRPAPPFGDVAVSFVHRARAGEALTRSRRPYGAATLTAYEASLRVHVLDFVDGRIGLPLRDLPADALLEGRTMQALIDTLAAKQSASVARVAAAAVAAVLRDAYGRRLVDELPPRVTLPPPPPGRSRVVTVEKFGKLLEAGSADDADRRVSLLAPLIALLLGAGLRVSEALGLAWGPDGLDLEHDPPLARVTRASTKTDAGARVVPLEPETAAALRRHFLATGRPRVGALVFSDGQGEPLPRHRIRPGFARVAKAAGLEGLAPHELRHSHATVLAVAGVPAPIAAARLGHADGGALFLRTYAHPGASDGESVLEALAAERKRRSVKSRHPRGTQAAVLGTGSDSNAGRTPDGAHHS